MKALSGIAGVTLIYRGNELGYPYIPCIKNLLEVCDAVYVSVGTGCEDGTKEALEQLGPRVHIIPALWVISPDDCGRELAKRANEALDAARLAGHRAFIYVQADEVVNPPEIVDLLSVVDLGQTFLEFERTYFWKDLEHINVDWSVGIMRAGPLLSHVRVAGDGMYLQANTSGYGRLTVPPDIARIYHYSRVGKTRGIADRLNNLDSFFHQPTEFEKLSDYEFGRDNNYEEGAAEATVISYEGPHPPHIEEFYKQ